MGALYAPDATFCDPAFPSLRGPDIALMWTMLCTQAKDFSLTFSDVRANDTEGSAHWEAKYRFRGNAQVHNIIDATFVFKDGLVTRHVDSFDFARWSRQALGPLGWAFGWTGLLQPVVQNQAAKGLAKFSSNRKQP